MQEMYIFALGNYHAGQICNGYKDFHNHIKCNMKLPTTQLEKFRYIHIAVNKNPIR